MATVTDIGFVRRLGQFRRLSDRFEEEAEKLKDEYPDNIADIKEAEVR